MAALPFQVRQWLVSALGTLLFLPLYVFWGGVFSFSYAVYDSIWAWGFGLTACWCQVLAILASFFYPRKAAFWMILNSAIGMLLAMGYIVENAQTHIQMSGPIEVWLHSGSGLFKASMIFLAPPLFFALLLLRHGRDEEFYAYVQPAAENNTLRRSR